MNARPPLVALLLVALVGCASNSTKVQPWVPPPIETSIAHHAGTSLSGAVAETIVRDADVDASARTVDADPSHALSITCKVVYLERFDSKWLTPLTERSRLVVSSVGGDPFQSTLQLASQARVGSASAAQEFLGANDDATRGRTLTVAENIGVLPKGVTVVFSNSAKPVELSNGRSAPRAADVEVTRDTRGRIEVTLVLEGPIDVANEESTESSGSAAERVSVRESILLEDAPAVDGEPLVLLFPSNLSESGAFAAVISAKSAPSDEAGAVEHRQRFATALANIGEVGESARARARDIGRREAWLNRVASARRALENPEGRRAALVFIATSTNAVLFEDAVYSASAEELEMLAQIALDATRGDGQATLDDEAALGWVLDARLYLRFAALVAEEKLPLEFAGVLLRQTGECGRWSDTIEACVRASKNGEDVRREFARENRIFLEDSAPGSRVRAFDWLSARGLAPKGFDPLSSAADRRRVLAALDEATETAGSRASQGGKP